MRLTYKPNPSNPALVDFYAGGELAENMQCLKGVRVTPAGIEATARIVITKEVPRAPLEQRTKGPLAPQEETRDEDNATERASVHTNDRGESHTAKKRASKNQVSETQ